MEDKVEKCVLKLTHERTLILEKEVGAWLAEFMEINAQFSRLIWSSGE